MNEESGKSKDKLAAKDGTAKAPSRAGGHILMVMRSLPTNYAAPSRPAP